MYKKISYLFVLPAVLFISGCSDVLSPANENINEVEDMYDDASYAEGILVNAYTLLPGNGWTFTDVATDNAVSNDNSNTFRQMATGQWTADNNPVNEWKSSRAAIQYLNIFLANADSVQWADDEEVNKLFNRRMKGEAYGLRANFMYHLLRNHAGWIGGDQSGELLGVPIVLDPQNKDSDFNKPRDTFEACMQQIYSDIEQARQLLTIDYGNVGDASQLPTKYDTVNVNNYNRVFGDFGKQRMSGRIAMAIKAKAALLAASPVYNAGTNTTWETTANYAGEVLDLNNGLAGLAPEGATWYDNASQINNLAAGSNPPEIIWRTNTDGGSTDLEEQNFPPTLYGNGRINPTQDLVDVFPMESGYPIEHPNSNYDASAPYQNRVPLLRDYILVNGGQAGVNNTSITTAADGNTNDALNAVETSTRTGYYLKKLLRQQVNLDPTSTNSQIHYTPRLRYTEIYLAYAEAANEAWGPNGMGGSFSFSSYDVIEAIRARQGVSQPDQYMMNEINSTADMRELIRNVRRIELAFEGSRFWDLRRWNMDMTESADGVRIKNGNHTIIDVEDRNYEGYMRYGPVPYNEILKFGLQQNYGW
jgi:hypothetical protein